MFLQIHKIRHKKTENTQI